MTAVREFAELGQLLLKKNAFQAGARIQEGRIVAYDAELQQEWPIVREEWLMPHKEQLSRLLAELFRDQR